MYLNYISLLLNFKDEKCLVAVSFALYQCCVLKYNFQIISAHCDLPVVSVANLFGCESRNDWSKLLLRTWFLPGV